MAINSILSDFTGEDVFKSNTDWAVYQDTIVPNTNPATPAVYSYTEGKYDSAVPSNTGTSAVITPFYYAGFDRKENKYVANLVNSSTAATGEVLFGPDMSGIKGFIATVKISTDTVTNYGSEKELFSVGSEYVANNGY